MFTKSGICFHNESSEIAFLTDVLFKNSASFLQLYLCRPASAGRKMHQLVSVSVAPSETKTGGDNQIDLTAPHFSDAPGDTARGHLYFSQNSSITP